MFPRFIDGKVMIPVRVEGPHGMIGDAMEEVPVGDPNYTKLKKWIEENNPVQEAL
jgi:hypothetical protein